MTRYLNGSESVLSPGPWAHLLAVRNCPCEDGIRRYVQVTGQPDTFFSQPARTKVKGFTVSGYLTGDEGGYRFVATGKNRQLIISEEYIRQFAEAMYMANPRDYVFEAAAARRFTEPTDKLVFADYLEERGHLQLAQVLRRNVTIEDYIK